VLAHSRNPGAAVAAVDRRMRRLYLSAFQSLLFNQVLAERIDSIDRVMPGDLAQRTDSGGIFLVEDEAAEQERAEAFAISPTGPLFGDKCRLASGEPGRIEEHVLCGHRVTLRPERREAALKLVPGGRRTLRFPLRNPDLSSGRDQHGTFIALAFELPSGCYATVVLDEIMKR
jgi:tRNA pseudouridine13 synthase